MIFEHVQKSLRMRIFSILVKFLSKMHPYLYSTGIFDTSLNLLSFMTHKTSWNPSLNLLRSFGLPNSETPIVFYQQIVNFMSFLPSARQKFPHLLHISAFSVENQSIIRNEASMYPKNPHDKQKISNFEGFYSIFPLFLFKFHLSIRTKKGYLKKFASSNSFLHTFYIFPIMYFLLFLKTQSQL